MAIFKLANCKRLPEAKSPGQLAASEVKLVGGLEHGWIMTFHSVGNFTDPN